MRVYADELSWIVVNSSGRQVINVRYADDSVLVETSPLTRGATGTVR